MVFDSVISLVDLQGLLEFLKRFGYLIVLFEPQAERTSEFGEHVRHRKLVNICKEFESSDLEVEGLGKQTFFLEKIGNLDIQEAPLLEHVLIIFVCREQVATLHQQLKSFLEVF